MQRKRGYRPPRYRRAFNVRPAAFTLIELLVVISIISLLISILMPSLGRARDQAKGVHCLARLREFGTALASYETAYQGVTPPAQWRPAKKDLDDLDTGLPRSEREIEYGWSELLWAFVYSEPVKLADSFPVQRNLDAHRWQKYFVCKAAGDEEGTSSGHYRVYLPAWSGESYTLRADGRYGETDRNAVRKSAARERVRPRLPIITDANERSERGDGAGTDDCSYIDAGEANYAGSDGARNGNRISDRHYGGANYLFQDLHGSWDARLRQELARDYDLNGTEDILIQP